MSEKSADWRSSDGVELRAFGHRHDPESAYRRASER